MVKRDERIDAYIANAAEFARPILEHLREVVHAGCPEVEETLKWGMPSFMYKGILCGMAAFKGHCTFGFWKHDLMFKDDAARAKRAEAMGSYGRITSLEDLPFRKVILAQVKEAMRLNDEGIKAVRRKAAPKKPAVAPPDLLVALKKNKKAAAAYEGFSPSHKREYIEWITEAKADETRARRVATAIEWIAEGKSRHWKYVKKPARAAAPASR